MNASTRILLGMAACAAFAGPAQAATVACGDVIDGETVVMDNDISNCTGTAVTLNNGAVLDMNGHFISCDHSMFTIGVNVQNGSTLKNGGVYNCEFSGVQIAGTEGSTVTGVHANNNGTGFNVFTSDSSSLKNNFAQYNTNAGFFITSGAHRVTSCVAAQNGTHGFNVTGAGSSVSGCTATANTGSGFAIASSVKLKNDVSTSNNVYGFDLQGIEASLSGSRAAANGGVGIVVAGSTNKVSKNNSSGNGGSGIYISGDTNSVSGNTVMGQLFGIATETTADQNTISKNLAVGNDDDLYTITAGCGTNVWSSNIGGGNDACIE